MDGGHARTPDAKPPVTLSYDNGKELKFTRTISVDDKYMFSVDDTVANSGSEAITLYPYGLVSRHDRPLVKGFISCMKA